VGCRTKRANAAGLSSVGFVGAALGGAVSGDCADAMGAANSVMATDSAAMRRKGTKVRVMLTSTG
jgi:hypothetical protein